MLKGEAQNDDQALLQNSNSSWFRLSFTFLRFRLLPHIILWDRTSVALFFFLVCIP